jgi:hypothetical protein
MFFKNNIYSMNQIYQIKFTKSSYELDKDYERLSEHEKVDIAAMTPESFFDFNNNEGQYILYLIFSPLDIEKYSRILNNNLIEHLVSNLSNEVLSNEFSVEASLKPFVNALNRFRWNSYKDKLDEWVYDNLDMDLVLDRIGQCGMENLRPVEKKFLRNFQN